MSHRDRPAGDAAQAELGVGLDMHHHSLPGSACSIAILDRACYGMAVRARHLAPSRSPRPRSDVPPTSGIRRRRRLDPLPDALDRAARGALGRRPTAHCPSSDPARCAASAPPRPPTPARPPAVRRSSRPGDSRHARAPARQHRHRANQIEREVRAFALQRRAGMAVGRPVRGARAAEVDHDHDRDHRQHVPARIGLVAPSAGQPADRLDRDHDARSDEDRALGQSPGVCSALP